jgi:beta-glucosidase/6-phospho-beta-glucosidase/beta-galactosidase
MWTDAPGEFKSHCAWTLYRAAHNMLLSHLEMSRVYKTQFQAEQNGNLINKPVLKVLGIIGLSLNGPWYEPYKNLKENEEAQKRAYEFWIGWLAHPLFSPEGDYSDILKERIANLSLLETRVTSRLPEFTQDEIEGLRSMCNNQARGVYRPPSSEIGKMKNFS